ncbi:MAG: amidase [Gammaproteobacteria bacterium]|nr:amidase [Gammaproteobacteria bacterium]
MSDALPLPASDGLDLFQLDATVAAAAIRDGRISTTEYVQSCLKRINALEESVQAWTYLDEDWALEQAAAADLAHKQGKSLGPLGGIPVGIKDIFDTREMPTENGTVLHAGRQPIRDAVAVAQLRQAGAIIMGKTVTTELAVYAPGRTRNPHDPQRTPGGSSSGSAAAVAAGMVPLSIGSQTNGSVIRPAAYCGVVGYKPSFAMISRVGALCVAQSLDHVGVFARSVEDVALVAEQMMGFDGHDPDMHPRPRPALVETVTESPPLTPRFAFVKTPVWEQGDSDIHNAFAELIEQLQDLVQEVMLAPVFEQVVDSLTTIMETELARNFDSEYRRGADQLSEHLRAMIENGQRHRAVDYRAALDSRVHINALLGEVFDEVDAIITPATSGEAPQGLDSTGSPIFCTLWTYCGLPAITLPLMEGSHGMPLGVQLVGPRGDDARLLRTARWLTAHLRG